MTTVSSVTTPVQALALDPITPKLWQELRSDHAGELGAVQIYRGILAVTRNEQLILFANMHMATEIDHLAQIEAWVPIARRSRLLLAWSVAGWLTGALPALFGANAVYRTIAAVETFVDQHYQSQLNLIDTIPANPQLQALRGLLAKCQQDEIHHRDEALACSEARAENPSLLMRCWLFCVSQGSAGAVAFAKRF